MYRIAIVALLVLAGVVYFTNLDGAPLRLNAEERCAEVVETMIATNDYARPRMGGELRLNKPPLFYWAAAACGEVGGGFSLTALRLPSAVGALGVLGIILLWGKLLNARREALLAAAMLSLSYLFVQQARIGSYEMLLTFFTSATLLAAAVLVQERTWRAGLLTAVCFTLALMTKGTPAFAVAMLPVAVWVVMIGQKHWLWNWRVLATFGGTILAGLGWYLYLMLARPDTRDDILAIALLPFGGDIKHDSGAKHYEAIYFYIAKIWEEAFPLSLLIPVAVLYIWRNRFFAADGAWRLVALSFAVPFAVFTLLPQKQDHYLLPMLPPLALVTARSALWGLDELRGRARLLLKVPGWVCTALLLVFGVFGAIGFLLIADWPVAAAVAAALVLVFCGGAAVWAMSKERLLVFLPSVAVGFALAWIGYFAVINPVVDNFGSGRIYFDPNYDPQEWTQKFEEYPFLVKLLDVKNGLDDREKLEALYNRPAAPVALIKGKLRED